MFEFSGGGEEVSGCKADLLLTGLFEKDHGVHWGGQFDPKQITSSRFRNASAFGKASQNGFAQALGFFAEEAA